MIYRNLLKSGGDISLLILRANCLEVCNYSILN
jgi:hypothetical protein